MRATKVNAGLAESNGKLLLGIRRDSLHVTCGLTACTPGSAPGPTLGNEYGKTLPLPLHTVYGWLGSRVVSVLDSGAEGPGSNRSRDAVDSGVAVQVA